MSKSFYNIYRPQTFKEVIGQEIPKRILINSLKQNKLNNSYLFYGIRGTGKTTLARIFAKSLNCLNLGDDFDPCNECASCKSINSSSSFDVIEIDAASNNGVDEIRGIKEKSNYLTTNSKYKIYIIDEVHMLSKAAFNALLKTLEEPPQKIIFILITTEISRIPDTILSRNIIINLEKLSEENITQSLINILEKENINYQKESLNYISLLASGSIRDAISLLELVLLYSKEFNENDVIKTLKLLKNEEIIKGINDIDYLIAKIDNSDLDIKKVLLQIIDFLTKEIILNKSNNYDLLNKCIEISLFVKDLHLLKLVFKGELLLLKNNKKQKEEVNKIIETSIKEDFSKNVSRETFVINEEKLSNEIFEKKINLENLKLEKNEIKEEKKQNEKITDYVNMNHYLTIMFENKVDKLKKYNDRLEYISFYLNKTKWSDYVYALSDSKILVAISGKAIIGIENEEKYNKFKNFSLEREFFNFLEELFGEKILLLPALNDHWRKLTLKFKQLKNENKRISEEIFIPNFSKLLEKTKESELIKLFDGKIEIK
ncbi:MAG: hypothetical protein HPAVJP_0400 [Candidatus Hepatoplasma vulgare]|nr:MAG: hypothetical protein HPAVJP_0400 [Candidatus Hepatoplasma sp.]